MRSLYLLVFVLLSSIPAYEQGSRQASDTSAYGNLVISSNPQEVRVEVPGLNIDILKTDKVLILQFIPPEKYLVRISYKNKIFEQEIVVRKDIERRLLFNLKTKKVELLEELRILHPVAVTDAPGDSTIFTLVEDSPTYPGGEKARAKFLQENLHYPEFAVRNGIQGTVFVTFVVDADGSLSNVRVLRGIGGTCDEGAIRVVKAMPKWIPGRQRGEAVRVQFNLPIRFSIAGKH